MKACARCTAGGSPAHTGARMRLRGLAFQAVERARQRRGDRNGGGEARMMEGEEWPKVASIILNL
ncbi:hypothetical protein [Methanothrix sp.]|uniref:hypothetical protein n=1 Tax=Methanothrix sp. TaxID=90426 RepID=UPI0034E1E314